MKSILLYLSGYVRQLPKNVFIAVSLLVAILITLNYTIGIESSIRALPTESYRIAGFFGLFVFTFTAAYGLFFLFTRRSPPHPRFFYGLLLAGPLIFALKMGFNAPARTLASFFNYPWSDYWYITASLPLKCGMILLLTWLVWKWGRYPKPVWGMTSRGFEPAPYGYLLLMMVPLIAFAATRPDFLHTYPKFRSIGFITGHTTQEGFFKWLYELCYGIDFVSIEVFFRGFLVLAFARYVGKDAILPMAAFYCTIHFGKPLFECITSYFGGLILGVVVYNTRSIWGGLMVHLGIAWLMELGGYLGNHFLN